MVQRGKALAWQVWQSEFDPQNQHKGGRRDLVPQTCPWTSTGTLWHMCPIHYAYTHSTFIKLKNDKIERD